MRSQRQSRYAGALLRLTTLKVGGVIMPERTWGNAMMRVWMILIILVAWAGDVWACKPVDRSFRCETLEEKIEQSDYIFKAKFSHFLKSQSNTPSDDRKGVARAVFIVQEAYKGNLKAGEKIRTFATAKFPPDCDRGPLHAMTHKEYFLFLNRCDDHCKPSHAFYDTFKCRGSYMIIFPDSAQEYKKDIISIITQKGEK